MEHIHQKEHFHVPWSVHQRSTFYFPWSICLQKEHFSTSHGAYIKRIIFYFSWSIYHQKAHFPCLMGGARTSKGTFSISHGAYTMKRRIFNVPSSVYQKEHILFPMERKSLRQATVYLITTILCISSPPPLMQTVSLVFGILVLQKMCCISSLLFSSIEYNKYLAPY